MKIVCNKKLFMNFVTTLLFFTYIKCEIFNSVFVMINKIIKMIYYKVVMLTINSSKFAKILINIVL